MTLYTYRGRIRKCGRKVRNKQGRPRVQITPSDLPESPGGKDPKDLNLLISVFGSQSPTAPGLANQFTRVICHSLFRHQHCINGISGTADHRAHHRRSLPLFTVCHIPVRLLPAGASICIRHRPLALNLTFCEHYSLNIPPFSCMYKE